MDQNIDVEPRRAKRPAALFGFQVVEPGADLFDQAADTVDFLIRRHGLGASPVGQ
jgi:hypothetical protein